MANQERQAKEEAKRPKGVARWHVQLEAILKLLENEIVTFSGIAQRFKMREEQVEEDLDNLRKYIPDLTISANDIQLPFFKECHYRDSTLTRALRENYEAKQVIAAYAARYLIRDRVNLAIDVGSTATIFARELVKAGRIGIRVASHSISVPLELIGSNTLDRFIGFDGQLHREAALLPEPIPSDWDPFQRAPYIAVITAESFSRKYGVGTEGPEIAKLNILYMKDAREVIMLIDHSKFFESAENFRTTWCGLEKKTDDWLPEERGEKQLTLITNALGKGRDTKEFTEFMQSYDVKTPDVKEFTDIRTFTTSLQPKREKKP